MRPVDVESVAHLNGIFAPIHKQISLKVVQGSIPRDLTGGYLRNGPIAGSHHSEATPIRSETRAVCHSDFSAPSQHESSST